MREDQSRDRGFREELAAIVGADRSATDVEAREAAFEALSRLERRSLIGGASDRMLRDIAEARFLVGILREAVRPGRTAGPRMLSRTLGRSGRRLRLGAHADQH